MNINKELERLVTQKVELSAVIEKIDTRLSNHQLFTFVLVNFFFVFQAVILTIICTDAETLKPPYGWFLFAISILAALLNLFALIITAIKYVETKGNRELFEFRLNKVNMKIFKLDFNYEDECDIEKPVGYGERQLKRSIFLAVYMIFLLGFAVVVLVSYCWKFLPPAPHASHASPAPPAPPK
uniref:Uncharacterized protein n=1 Tax=Quercus lobata TaxID=97700 RepID=A0A7N2MNF0_QUELO